MEQSKQAGLENQAGKQKQAHKPPVYLCTCFLVYLPRTASLPKNPHMPARLFVVVENA